MPTNQTAFISSGDYYDLFYSDKSYVEEAAYFINLIRKYTPEAKSILELGSGSGNFSALFSNAGYEVTGIERSEGMLQKAKQKNIVSFTPQLGDISAFDLNTKFDVAVSLFDVICYLTTTQQILSCLQCVHRHLNENGYFIFDSWHTAGVYATLPEVRSKEVEDSYNHIKRIATPSIHFDTNTVDVDYEFQITDKKSNITSPFFEKHSLRHFSILEIAEYAAATGFELITSEELLTGNMPTQHSWKVCHILKRK